MLFFSPLVFLRRSRRLRTSLAILSLFFSCILLICCSNVPGARFMLELFPQWRIGRCLYCEGGTHHILGSWSAKETCPWRRSEYRHLGKLPHGRFGSLVSHGNAREAKNHGWKGNSCQSSDKNQANTTQDRHSSAQGIEDKRGRTIVSISFDKKVVWTEEEIRVLRSRHSHPSHSEGSERSLSSLFQ